jgi:hypothetical protein
VLSSLLVLLSLGTDGVSQVQSPVATTSVQRAVAAHGSQLVTGEIQDWIAKGRIVLYGRKGPQETLEVTLQHKGRRQVQRILTRPDGEARQGSDGSRQWQSFLGGKFTASAVGRSSDFVDSQTIRSVQALLNYQGEKLTLRDAGTSATQQIIESQDQQGKKTKYFIDTTTWLVTRLEFVIGQSQDIFTKQVVDRIDAYVFSDFRPVQGVQTPFKIERFTDGMKTEEMQFTSVQYNNSLNDGVFRP